MLLQIADLLLTLHDSFRRSFVLAVVSHAFSVHDLSEWYWSWILLTICFHSSTLKEVQLDMRLIEDAECSLLVFVFCFLLP